MKCPDCAAVEARVAALEARVLRIEGGLAGAAGVGPSAKVVASDDELDGEGGDPKVTMDPPRWKGRSFVGLPYSHTDPAFLEELAKFQDWCADKESKTAGKEKYAPYSRARAARARGWAARMKRNGWKPPPPPAPVRNPYEEDRHENSKGSDGGTSGRDDGSGFVDDDIPF